MQRLCQTLCVVVPNEQVSNTLVCNSSYAKRVINALIISWLSLADAVRAPCSQRQQRCARVSMSCSDRICQSEPCGCGGAWPCSQQSDHDPPQRRGGEGVRRGKKAQKGDRTGKVQAVGQRAPPTAATTLRHIDMLPLIRWSRPCSTCRPCGATAQ